MQVLVDLAGEQEAERGDEAEQLQRGHPEHDVANGRAIPSKKNVGKRCCGAETFALAARAHEEAAYGHGREELGRDEPEDLAEEAVPDRGLRRIDRVVAILKVLQLLRWVARPLRRSGCTSDGGRENSGVGAGRLGAAWDAACWAGCMARPRFGPEGRAEFSQGL